ncbi:MAG: DUF349 domain-containing protein [Paraglaciecola sp.]|uniref:DUF349 domain-containing protein n=1 Tax=Paraglaciecola sp. TaxID=1920173 RepID=UPI00329A2238
MIFKRLFRAKHLSPDPLVRIEAIETLNNQASEQKSILHELAFNDAEPKVSLAALHKLDSFVLWYKMSEIAKNELVRRKSVQYVETVLLSEDNTILTASQRRNVVLEVKDNALLEKIILQPWVQNDAELVITLLAKVDRPLLRDKVFLNTQNETLQFEILSSLKDVASNRKLLNKFIKKTPTLAVKSKAKELLSLWLKLEKIPVETEQKVTMLLSCLLALKDSQDFEYVQIRQQELNQEYTNLAVNFDKLNETKVSEIQQKYIDISSKVDRNFEMLKPVWMAQQAKLELKSAVDTITADVERHLQAISTELDTRISEISSGEVDSFKQTLRQSSSAVQDLISQAPADEQKKHKQLESLNNRVNSTLNTLSHLPEFQVKIHAVRVMLEQFEGLALPSDSSQVDASQEHLNDVNQKWRALNGGNHSQLPNELIVRWNKQSKSWGKAIADLRTELSSELNRCRNKLKSIDSLVRQGKFKAAMGLYRKVTVWFDRLNEKQQAQLHKTYSDVQQQIENLKDWQDYICAPRKPALLKEVDRLIANPLNIGAQAKAIKVLRSQWNSLGKTETESDQVFNDAFEVAIEAAFSPCREHYDEQQKQREANLQLKMQVLADLKGLSKADSSIMELAKKLRHVQQTWRNIGEVDFKLRKELYEKYQTLVAPLKLKISEFHNDNAKQKQTLLNQARLLIELEPITEAIEQAKKLQEKWKSIEHAGRKAEADLWQAFRQANDNLFTKRAELNQQHKLEVKEQIKQLKLKVSTLKSNLTEAKGKAELILALQDAPAVRESLTSLPSSIRNELESEINGLFENQKKKLSELTKNEKSKEYVRLFEALRCWEQGANKPDVTDLRKNWQSGFTKAPALADRDEITLKMEVIADKPSPVSEQSKRKQVQMELMAHRLQTGDSLELNTLLVDWIKGGELSETDKPLLERVERVFVS